MNVGNVRPTTASTKRVRSCSVFSFIKYNWMSLHLAKKRRHCAAFRSSSSNNFRASKIAFVYSPIAPPNFATPHAINSSSKQSGCAVSRRAAFTASTQSNNRRAISCAAFAVPSRSTGNRAPVLIEQAAPCCPRPCAVPRLSRAFALGCRQPCAACPRRPCLPVVAPVPFVRPECRAVRLLVPCAFICSAPSLNVSTVRAACLLQALPRR